MKTKMFLMAAACAVALPAYGKILTRSYVADYVFDGGPLKTLKLYMTLTFDPTAHQTFGSAFINYKTNSNLQAFKINPVSFKTDLGGFETEIIFSGLLNGEAVESGTDDFLGFFYVNSNGIVDVPFTGLAYTIAGYDGFYGTPNPYNMSTIRSLPDDAPPPGVPEPSTWAVMVAGFGMIGAAIRSAQARRTRLSTV